MQVLLRIANGKSNVRKVRIQSDTVIGRSPECQLKVASNQISRRHCLIVIRDTVVAIKDLGSANGTFVNGRQVPPEVEIPLTPGTRVMLGPLQFTVEYDLPGMPTTTVAPVEAGLAESASPNSSAEPEVEVETLPAVSSDGLTPFPPVVIVPPVLAPAQHSPPPPIAAAVLEAAPPAAFDPVAVPLVAEPVPGVMSNPVVTVPAPVASLPEPTVMMSAPLAPPAATNLPSPAAPLFVVPAAEAPADNADQDTGGFNFGIFAASGSDVVIESAAEIPMILEPKFAAVPKVDSSKPGKTSLLQMFGWGKKKPATPEPIAVPETVPEPVANVTSEEVLLGAAAPAEELTFEIPSAEEAPAADDDSPDDSFQNFFNNFK